MGESVAAVTPTSDGKSTMSWSVPLNDSTTGYVGKAWNSSAYSYTYLSSEHPMPIAYVMRSRVLYDTATPSSNSLARKDAVSTGSRAAMLLGFVCLSVATNLVRKHRETNESSTGITERTRMATKREKKGPSELLLDGVSSFFVSEW